MTDDDPMAKYTDSLPEAVQDLLRSWANCIADLERVTAERDALQSAVAGALTCCRECGDELPIFATNVPPADFIVWGKLCPPEALGPKCYDHAVKHLGSSMPFRSDQYAVVDLRPLRAALKAGS